jgi:PAS domain S-box-containing protein
MESSSPNRKARPLLLLALTYFTAAKLGMIFAIEPGHATAIWPASGIALAALWVGGIELWPGIWLGSFFANLATSLTHHSGGTWYLSGATSALMATGGALEAVLGLLLIRSTKLQKPFWNQISDTLKFILFACALSPLVAATLGTLAVVLQGAPQTFHWSWTWITWWLGDAAGIVIFTPILLVFQELWRSRQYRNLTKRSALEFVFLILGVSATSWTVFSGWAEAHSINSFAFATLLLPWMIWIALRFGQTGASAAILVSAGIAGWGTVNGLGPFGQGNSESDFLALQGFFALRCVTVWVLVAALSERQLAEASLIEKERQELRESRELFQQFMNNCPATAFMKDEAGRLLYINPAFEKSFDFKTRDWFEKNDVELWGKEVGAQLRENDRIILAGGKAVTVEETVLQRGRSHQWLTIKFPIQKSSGEKILAGMGIDLTQRIFLSEASKILARSLDLTATTRQLSRLIVPFLGDWCAIALLDAESGTAEVVAAHGSDQASPDPSYWESLPGLRLSREGSSCVARVLRGEGTWIGETEIEAYLTSLKAPGAGFRPSSSAMAVPLIVRDQVAGVILLGSSKNNDAYGKEQVLLAEELAYRASLAIDNARLYQAAQSAIHLRDDFISVASHELKTPLTSLRLQGFAVKFITDQLTSGQYPKGPAHAAQEFQKLFEIFEKQVLRLQTLVSDLLDVSRISTGAIQLRRENADLGKIALEVVQRFSPEAKLAQCEIQEKIMADVFGLWDRGRIDQVIVNLLTNSIKYGAGKPIEISVSRVGERALLSVRDQGIGVLPQDQTRIFGRFERAVSNKNFGGLGLGLHIASQIVNAHGGVIRVESIPGQGSTFTIELPL